MPLFGLLKPGWARGAEGAEAIASAFIASEVGKPKPGFAGLAKLLKDMTAADRNQAWRKVGEAFKTKGDKRTANQCFVEAVFNDPDSASPAWSEIELPSTGTPGVDALRQRLSSLPRRSISGDRPGNASLASSLRRLFGEPGQG
jgi:hypothetical protein